jgi:hypothetical protein
MFREWHSVSLIRGGAVIAQTTPHDIYWMILFAFTFLLPCLSLVPKIGDTLIDDSSLTNRQQQYMDAFWLVVAVSEMIGMFFCIKLIEFFAGISNTV